MLHFTSNLCNLTIDATDGEMGKIKDIYLNGSTWKIRYTIVDTRKWLPERKVLLPPSVFIGIDEDNEKVEVGYEKSTIKNRPSVPENSDLIRDKENKLMNAFDWDWPNQVLVSGEQRPLGMFRRSEQEATEGTQSRQDEEEEALLLEHRDNNLRSHKEIIGARVHAKDGKIGKLIDFIYDEDWYIRYLVLISNDFNKSGHYVYSTDKISSIDWFEADIYLNELMNNFKMRHEFPDKTDILNVLQ